MGQKWLLKSEPNVWSIDQQIKMGSKGSDWDGVRNYQAANNLKKMKNCKFIHSTIDEYFSKKTILYDFGYCLGVLHHIPNTQKALNKMTKKLKKNSPLLLYIPRFEGFIPPLNFINA